ELSLPIQERLGHVTVDATLDAECRPGEPLRYAGGVVHRTAKGELGTRGPGKVVLEIGRDPVSFPEGQGPDVRRAFGEIGDDGVGDAHGLGEVPDQGLEELLTGAPRGPLNHPLEGAQPVGYLG